MSFHNPAISFRSHSFLGWRRPVTALLLFTLGATLFALTLPVSAGGEDEEKNPKPPAKKVPLPGEEEEKETKPPLKKLPGVDPGSPDTAPMKPLPGIDPNNPEPAPMPKTPNPPNTTNPPTEAETPAEKDPTLAPYLVKLTEIVREVNAAKHPVLKDFYAQFTVAFDRIAVGSSKPVRVTPLPLLWGKDRYPAEFGVSVLDDNDTPGDPRTLSSRQVRDVVAFELFAMSEVDRLLTPTTVPANPPLLLSEKQAAAEKVLVAVFFFHDSAREQNRRRGKSWDTVKNAISDKLVTVRMGRLKSAGDAHDWPKLKELSTKFADLYRSSPKVLEQVYTARLTEAEVMVKSDRQVDLERSRELLFEYETRFPNTGNAVALRVRKGLADRAAKMIADAQRMFDTNKTEARNILTAIEKIDPDNSNLRLMQQNMKLGYPVLFVGMRQMPEFMSPALARFDSEHQISEAIFEGLLDAVPDDVTGVRYVSNLSTDRGVVGAGVRDFRLVGSANWSGPDSGLLNSADVAGTLRLMRQKPASWVSDVATWLDDPGFDPSDLGRIKMRFKLGHPDPRSLLTMKVHPAGWLLAKNKQIDDADFGRQPFGTGPYRLAPIARAAPNSDAPREVILLANQAYARRPNKLGQPFIKEIRFVDVSQSTDLPADFRGDRLHILPDVSTTDLAKFTAGGNLGGRVQVVTAVNPHRIHILAINHRRPNLQNPDVRRGLLHAIDRDRILADIFRAPAMPEAHRPLTGPFPAGSWATPRPLGGNPPSLFNRDLAAAKFRQYLTTPTATPAMTLIYPNDDSDAKRACERMKLMVESPTSSDAQKITLILEPVAPRELLRRVEVENRYDLAYMAFDYRDEWYPQILGSFLDPTAAVQGGRNYLGYLANGSSTPAEEDLRLSRSLAECRLYRDPQNKLSPLTQRIHQQFNDAVPFIPLWQLDRHMVISTAVKVFLDGQVDEAPAKLLNPTTLFDSVGRWRLE